MDLQTENEELRRKLAVAETALHRSNERIAAVEPTQARLNALLVRFADAVRGVLDPRVVAATACRLITRELGADRAYWSEVDWTTREFVIGADYHAPDVEPVSGRFPLDGWEPFSSYHLAGRPVVVSNTTSDPRGTPDLLKGYEALGIRADLAVPVLVGDKLRSVLAVNQGSSREWSPDEITFTRRVADWCWAEIERARAEAALRESEERQAFLLDVSDALRPIKDPADIQRTATRMLGDHLDASRVFYVTVGEDGDTADILADYTNGVPTRIGRYSLSDFSLHGLGEWRAGRTASTSDVNADPRYSKTAREAYASVSTRAGFGVPLIKEGRLVAILGVNQSSPRHWSEQDLSLAAEIAERTWAAVERALAEAAVRKSEERQAFLLKLSDGLRPLRDAREVRAAACRVLGEHLSASRA